jgi:hypothetical protein
MPIPLLAYLFVVACAWSVPVIVLVLLAGLPPRVGRALIAVSFAAATAYTLWRIEWFDVWRHGFPGVGYILSVFVPYSALYGAIGWALGGLIVRRRLTARG